MTRRVVARIDPRRQRGNTVIGLIIGIVIGLGIAAAVALLVTKATVPFVSKQARATPTGPDTDSKLPDPNRGLYSKDPLPAAPSSASSASSSTVASAPASSVESGANGVIAPPPPNVAPGADGKVPAVDASPSTGITQLQAGAFSSADDAESMRGRLALLGFESRVQPAERDGARIFRVRLGPYGRMDELNRARQRLIENGVEATLVAPGR